MNELQLVGYTADLTHLVLSDSAGATRHRVPIDDDLVATIEEVIGLARPGSELYRPPPPAPTPPPPPPPPAPRGPEPGTGTLAAMGVLVRASTVEQEDAGTKDSKLSPREIQALLRSGKTAKQVAKRAGTSESMVGRWLPPIEAEREQVLIGVMAARISKARLGPSREPVGEAVRRNLASKGVGLDDDDTEWRIVRRDGDDHWTVELRYRSRGRAQRAIYRYEPETKVLEPRNALATDVAWVRPRAGSTKTAKAAGGTQRGTGRKGAAKKASAKRAPAKRSTAKKATAKKATAKKATAKKATAKKATAKRAPAKKSTAKKATAKKATAKKATAKKAAAKRAPAKKVTPKRATAKKTSASGPRGS